ncbi:hypothetical protein GCM10009793_30480 [Brachybacterium phenoliresistens]|uniref:Uncharacterized protein n=1 Tax=Brachybacterium phenoliresistens TaxID=396014 RepID=Z9JU50_9MICO|nr:hypothetical protein BF93_15230 [Brachybacterium phenoliresistens]
MSGPSGIDVTGRERHRELDGLRAIAAFAVVATRAIDSHPHTSAGETILSRQLVSLRDALQWRARPFEEMP